MRSISTVVFISMLIPFIAAAGESKVMAGDSAITISGVVDFSMGEVMNGLYKATKNGLSDEFPVQYPNTVSHAWFGQPLAQLNLGFNPGAGLKVVFGFEANVFLNTFPAELINNLAANGGQDILPSLMDWRIHQAQGIFSLVNNSSTSLFLSAGLMPYKYNPDVRNLGEFLFRSGTYPFFLINNYNFPLARLSGLRLNFNYGTEKIKLTFDQFVLTERDIPPMNDLSFATIVGVNIMNILEIGGGVDFAHALSVNKRLTTPDSAVYITDSTAVTDSFGTLLYWDYNYGHYSFAGTKIMARMTIDPFGAVRGDKESAVGQIFGENGGKIYGEIAIAGLKNYPASLVTWFDNNPMNPFGYTTITERMPWMVGIDIPTWKILDVCAFELEKYPAPYPNDYYQAFYNKGLPIPTWFDYYGNDPYYHRTGTEYDSAEYRIDRWSWSLYMKKQVFSHFSLIGQIAKDHMRWEVNAGKVPNYDTEEITVKPGQWTWRAGMLFGF
jgi:hypothetical protein